MSKTAAGLVEYVKAQVGKPYWYGTFGNTSTKSLLTSKRNQYPRYYDQSKYNVKFENQIGQRVHDCVGLIKGYLWSETATSTPKYNSAQDVSANGMRGKCKEQGGISTMPEIPGVLVFFSGHVGVYIGDGKVIEARGHDYGVVTTNLKDRPWLYWGKCPWIEYPDISVPAKTYFKQYTGGSVSLVDALKSIKADSNFAYRKKIANANGISAYIGTVKQNTSLLNLLKQGKLIKP